MYCESLLKAVVLPCMLFISITSFAQEKTISGKVTDSKDGSGIPGVSAAGGGNLTSTNSNNIKLPSGGAGLTGYYRVRASEATMTWGYTKINTWGIIGAFNGWSANVPMTFNTSTGVWSITRDMPAGEFKFRANDDWGINFGDNNADFKPEYDGSNLNISAAGNYTISLDLSVGGNYAYTIKKN